MGHSSSAAPSCRRADGTALQSLPNRIGELKKLKNLCVAARSVHFTRPRRATVRRRFIDRCNLTKLPDSICDLTISSLYARPPLGVGIQSVQARPHCRDVSTNALRELPECVCKMGLTSLYAPPEAWTRDLPRRASAGAAGMRSTTSCRRCPTSKAAERAARRRCFTCASALLRSAGVVDRRCYGGEALVRGRLVGHNQLKALPRLPPTLQRLC